MRNALYSLLWPGSAPPLMIAPLCPNERKKRRRQTGVVKGGSRADIYDVPMRSVSTKLNCYGSQPLFPVTAKAGPEFPGRGASLRMAIPSLPLTDVNSRQPVPAYHGVSPASVGININPAP